MKLLSLVSWLMILQGDRDRNVNSFSLHGMVFSFNNNENVVLLSEFFCYFVFF